MEKYNSLLNGAIFVSSNCGLHIVLRHADGSITREKLLEAFIDNKWEKLLYCVRTSIERNLDYLVICDEQIFHSISDNLSLIDKIASLNRNRRVLEGIFFAYLFSNDVIQISTDLFWTDYVIGIQGALIFNQSFTAILNQDVPTNLKFDIQLSETLKHKLLTSSNLGSIGFIKNYSELFENEDLKILYEGSKLQINLSKPVYDNYHFEKGNLDSQIRFIQSQYHKIYLNYYRIKESLISKLLSYE